MGEVVSSPFLRYYSRKDVQQRIVEVAQSREVGVRYPDGGFGKRPEVLQYPSEVLDLAKRGAVSFHMSEERWSDALQLRPGMSRGELDNLRIGFDLMFDIDCKFIEFSKRCVFLIEELLHREGIKHVHTKFTGSTGFHMGVNFEALPKLVEGREVKNLFPDMMRAAAEYVKEKIHRDLAASLLDISEWKEMADALGKPVEKLKDKDGRFNPFSVIDIDSVAISSRHMLRASYSINEKSGRASIPVTHIKNFDIRKAKWENVETNLGFLDKFEDGEAKNFLDNVFMHFYAKQSLQSNAGDLKMFPQKDFEIPKIAIKDPALFPPCVNLLLQGVKEDGRKRAIFVMINYLRQMGWSFEDIEVYLQEWNTRNYEKLREGYIRSQVSWFKKQNAAPRTPSCANESYMKGLGVCQPDGFCKFIKNPAQYTLKKIRRESEKKEKKSK
ncbi:MAG: hypothetical protein Q7R96_03255 [Nanoarchaeota archaeon]|nr:hypothetical protein [Nanoarchaeota archaeon]